MKHIMRPGWDDASGAPTYVCTQCDWLVSVREGFDYEEILEIFDFHLELSE